MDKFVVDRAALMSRETGADLTVRHNIRKNPMKNFAEAALGNTCDNSGREGFLKYDRKVETTRKTAQPPPALSSSHNNVAFLISSSSHFRLCPSSVPHTGLTLHMLLG